MLTTVLDPPLGPLAWTRVEFWGKSVQSSEHRTFIKERGQESRILPTFTKVSTGRLLGVSQEPSVLDLLRFSPAKIKPPISKPLFMEKGTNAPPRGTSNSSRTAFRQACHILPAACHAHNPHALQHPCQYTMHDKMASPSPALEAGRGTPPVVLLSFCLILGMLDVCWLQTANIEQCNHALALCTTSPHTKPRC